MEQIDRRLLLMGAGLTGAALLARAARAGPLNPPAGPVSSTGKTLQEIYDKVGPTGSIAEARTAVQSLAASATGLYRITQPGSYYLTGNIQGVSGKNGIEIAADDVTVDLNGFALEGVTGALAGIAVLPPEPRYNPRILNGAIRGWPQRGVDGELAYNAHARDLAVSWNGVDGVRLGRNASIVHCTARENLANGLGATFAATILGCCADTNGADGLYIDNIGIILDCTAAGGARGAVTGGKSLIRGCAFINTGTGVGTSGFSQVLDNSFGDCAEGIEIYGDEGTRLEGNNLARCGVGIRVNGTGHLVVRNSARNCTTPYQIPAGNAYGPLVPVTGDLSLLPAAAHPWANFIY